MFRIILFAVVAIVAGCKMTERTVSTDEYMPGYRIEIPRDLPKTGKRYGKDGSSHELSRQEIRDDYEREHKAGWRECFWGYRNGQIDLSRPCPELRSSDGGAISHDSDTVYRARRDGYEECRRLLLSNGNK